MGPRADEKFEKRGLDRTKGSIHMYLPAESGRSKSGPFVIDDYFL